MKIGGGPASDSGMGNREIFELLEDDQPPPEPAAGDGCAARRSAVVHGSWLVPLLLVVAGWRRRGAHLH